MRSFLALIIGLCVIVFASPLASGAESSIDPVLLFLQPADALEPVGLLTFEANPLILRGPITPVRSDPAATPPAAPASFLLPAFPFLIMSPALWSLLNNWTYGH